MHGPFKLQHSNIKAIRLRREFKVRMNTDLPDAERVGGQRLHGWVYDVIAWDKSVFNSC